MKRFGLVPLLCMAAPLAMAVAAPLPVSAQTAPAQGAPAANNNGKAILKVNMVRGFVTLYVNGQQVGKYGKASILSSSGDGLEDVDVSSRIKPGDNTLRAVWKGPQTPIGSIRVSYAPSGNTEYRVLSTFDFGAMTDESGDKTITFKVPTAGTNKTVEADTAAKGQVAPGSHDNQVLMTANIVRGHITAFVNGKKVGSYETGGVVPLDISDYVHPGANKLRLSWDETGPPTGSIRISYAASANQFRILTEYDLTVFTKKKAGKTSEVTFNVPK